MNRSDKNLLLLAENLVFYGRKKGADQVEVSIGEGNEFSVEIREGEVERLVEAGLMLEEDVGRVVAMANDWGRPQHDVRL